MTAYVIFTREEEVKDADALAEYQRRNRESAGAHDITPLVVYGNVEALEGDQPDGVIVLAFPSVEQAKAWYYSEDYQAAKPFRDKAARYRGFIVEGIGS